MLGSKKRRASNCSTDDEAEYAGDSGGGGGGGAAGGGRHACSTTINGCGNSSQLLNDQPFSDGVSTESAGGGSATRLTLSPKQATSTKRGKGSAEVCTCLSVSVLSNSQWCSNLGTSAFTIRPIWRL
eukprot:gene16009-21104_t